MLRVVPSTFVTGQPVAIDLTTPIGASPTDMSPLWARAVAAILNQVAGTRDVLASTKN
jgi:hypothetical protein